MERAGPVYIRALFLQQPLDLAHCHVPVAARIAFEPLPLGPVGGIDARPPAERSDRQAAVVGQRDDARRLRRCACLEQRVLDEGGAGFGRFGQTQRPGRQAFHAMRFEQRGNLFQLAGVMRGNHERARTEPACHLRVASSCALKICAQPICANRSRRRKASSS